ncbi:MAG: HAMP domain-containing histidine kinase, partial [Bacteroides intestinalis]|nr:HAMP domain-containing histidine kinase [Bacteroides intestinalis]
MELLLWILLVAYLIGTLAIILLNKWIAHIAYHPFRDVIKQVNNISTNNLDIRIESPNTQDELQNLIETFNDLLAKISETFVIQKNFVSYVSHEFKTPLAAIQGNLEVFSIKDRSPEEYKSLSEKLIQQISQMEEILNTLIIISDLRNNSDITTQIRIDELVWEIVSKISKLYTKANISVKMDILPQDMHILLATKDRTQILIALYNLIENGVKFSREKMVSIDIFKQDGKLCLLIKDQGIGI